MLTPGIFFSGSRSAVCFLHCESVYDRCFPYIIPFCICIIMLLLQVCSACRLVAGIGSIFDLCSAHMLMAGINNIFDVCSTCKLVAGIGRSLMCVARVIWWVALVTSLMCT